jgi:hypothetical protein
MSQGEGEEEGGIGEEEAKGGAGGKLRPAGRRAEQGRVGSVVWRRPAWVVAGCCLIY